MLSAWLPITMMLMPCSCGSVLRALDLLERRVDDVDDVGLRRLEHVEADGRAVVEVPADLQLRCDELDVGDVAEAHRRR